MKIKNIHLVEQHAEKGVLALCVLAAGYLGYSALTSPLTFDDNGTAVEVKSVEAKITANVQTLKTLREANGEKANGWVNPWANEKSTPMAAQGVSKDLLALGFDNRSFPPLAPAQRLDGKSADVGKPTAPELKCAMLPPIAPGAPVAEEKFGKFLRMPNGAAAAAILAQPVGDAGASGTPAAPPATPGAMGAGGPGGAAEFRAVPVVAETKYVSLKATYDVSKELTTLQSAKEGHKALDRTMTQRVVYVGVEVRRTETFPDDSARKDGEPVIVAQPVTEEVPVMLPANTGTDDEVTKWVEAENAARPLILQPRYFPEAGNLPLTGAKPVPVPATATAPAVRPGTAGGRAAATSPRADSVAQPADHAPGGAMAAVGGVPAVGAIADNAGPITIQAYDDTAVPGHTYKYEMRVVIFNPAYRDVLDQFDPATLNAEPTLVGEWSPVSNPVTIDANQYLYATKDGNFWVYQWMDAKWVSAIVQPRVGEVVGTQDSKNPIDTGYILVDARLGDDKKTVASVVLMDVKDNKLLVRDPVSDEQSRLRHFPSTP